MAIEILVKQEKPNIDYWMIGVLHNCIKTEMKRVTSGFRPDYIAEQVTMKNEWNPIGQLERIRDRLEELQLFYDNEIKEGLLKLREEI